MARSLSLVGAMPEPEEARPRFAIAGKGFRPFFLLAAVFAALIVPIWLFIVGGALAPGTYLDAWSWHAHEMIFGYAVAVIAGFLLTAVGNWTQRETVVGTPLLLLAGLWLLGRVVMAVAAMLPRGVPALVDLAFLPLLGVVLARPLVATRNRRNFVMLAVVAALFAANLAMHLTALGVLPHGTGRRAYLVAIDVIVFLILAIAGRIMPMFTRNATGVSTIVSSAKLDRATLLSAAGLVAVDLVWPETTPASIVALAVGLLAAARAARWGAMHTARHPLLWILFVGYAWIPAGLLLRALPLVGLPVWSSLSLHALTAGSIGCMTLGMMARVALGHSGRPLVPSPAMTWSFAAMALAGITRVLVPLVAMPWYLTTLSITGALWTLAFLIYVVVYAPVLTLPRIDGKPG